MAPKDLATTDMLEKASEICSSQGARLTPLRRSVLELILTAETPATAYQLLDRLQQTRKGAAPPTIYRTLDFLIEQRLVHKVERLNAFVPCCEPGRLHERPMQFLICRQCGRVTELADEVITRAILQAAHLEGFHPGAAVVELEGLCATCRQPECPVP